MKKISAIAIFVLMFLSIEIIVFAELSPAYKEAVYNIFPSLHNFAEEKNNWLDSSILEENFDTYTVLKKTYTYYSKTSQVILDIKRDPTFTVDVTIFITKDYQRAADTFNQLQKEIKYKYKKEMGFGQESYLYIYPVDEKKLKAKFYTLTKNQNFIVKIESNDGFAIMDFTEYISNNLANFIYQNIDIYTFNRLRIKCTLNDKTSKTSDILLLNKKYKALTIEGTVKNAKLENIEGATIELLELGIKTISDTNGHFILKGVLGKTGSNIKLTKHFIFDETGKDTSPYNYELYEINVNYNNKDNMSSEILYLKVNKNITGYGDIYVTKNKEFDPVKVLTNDGKKIVFIRDCSTGLFSCRQKFTGVKTDDAISGSWDGFGGGGNFTGKQLSGIIEEKVNLKNSNLCSIGVLIEKQDGTIHTSYVGSLYSYIYPEEKSYVLLHCNPVNKNLFFLKDAYLELYHLPQQQFDKINLGIYYGTIENNKLELYDRGKEFVIKNFNEPTKITLNITDYLIDRLYVDKQLLIGVKEAPPVNLIFGGMTAPLAFNPKIVLANFDTKHSDAEKVTISARLCNDQSKDFESHSITHTNGKNDICISFDIKNTSGIFNDMVITYKSTYDFIWNLKDDDIYPGIVFVKNGKPFNMKNYKLDGNLKFEAYITKPDFFEYTGSLNYLMNIDGKAYKGSIPLEK